MVRGQLALQDSQHLCFSVWTVERMSPLLVLGLLVAGFCPAVLCLPDGTLDRDTPAQEDQDNRTQVDSLSMASSNTDFAFSLYKQLALKNPDKNVVFSPVSISAALAFLSLGADSNSLVEILEGLKFNLTETPEPDIHQGFSSLLRTFRQPGEQSQLSMGSTMFIEEQLQLLAKFQEEARALYQAEAFTTDFQQLEKAKKLINDYVKNGTQGKIKELISDLDKDTRIVLANYILFKGKWVKSFNPLHTFDYFFYLNKTQRVVVPMMTIRNLTAPYFRDEVLSCSVVELEYQGGASALFIFPDLGRMRDVEASLNPETLRRWKDSLRPRRIDELYLPKFSISADYSLENVLPQLGIKEVFSKQADLSKITGGKHLMVSQVVHKAVLDVDEVGTEAAAAMEITGVFRSGRIPQMTLLFNRPFLIQIFQKETKSILFLAKVANPKQA